MAPGDMFKADGERQRYKVVAADGRHVIAIKPMNARRTYLYTIIDRQGGVRGPCNLIFGIPFDLRDDGEAQEALAWLQRGDMGVSHRRCVAMSAAEVAQVVTPPST